MTRADQVVAWPAAQRVQPAEEGGHRRTVRTRSLRRVITRAIVVAGRQHRCGAGQWVATGQGPACGPLPSWPRPKAVAGTATMAAGACAPGVASSHDVTGHVVGVGIEPTTDGIRIRCSDQAELSSWEPRGIEPRTGEPVPASSRRSRRWPVRDLRHTPRQRRAHQPVVETGPLENRGCRPPTLSRAIMFGCDADNVQASPFARSKSFGGAEKPGSVSGGLPRGVQFWHRGSLCRRKRKRPRDLRSEGVVRPRRSGWPISAGRVSGRCQLDFLAERARQHVHAQAWQQFGDGDGMRVQGKFPVVVETRCAR